MLRFLRMLVASILVVCSASLFADGEIITFKNAQSKENYTALVNELRCLVCQNQTIGDSEADLAKDLRAKVYDMVEAGQSQSDVVDYMTARYGDFVLYRPAFKVKTILLWLGPLVFLLLSIFFVIRWVRSQSSAAPVEQLSSEQQASIREMLDKTDSVK